MKKCYYAGEEIGKFTFLKVPKEVLSKSSLSAEAKLLFALFLERTGLSLINNMSDEEGRIYIIYSIGEIMDSIGCSKPKAVSCLAELEAAELIEKKRRGRGLSQLIYVRKVENSATMPSDKPAVDKTCAPDETAPEDIKTTTYAYVHKVEIPEKESSDTMPLDNPGIDEVIETAPENIKTTIYAYEHKVKIPEKENSATMPLDNPGIDEISETQRISKKLKYFTSRSQKSLPQEVKKIDPNNIYTSNINNIYTKRDNLIYLSDKNKLNPDDIRDFIHENISYHDLIVIKPDEKNIINEFVELIVETLAAPTDYVRVAGRTMPFNLVKSRLEKIDFEIMSYVIDCFTANTLHIRNIKAYMLTCLYNAPGTYQAYMHKTVSNMLAGTCGIA